MIPFETRQILVGGLGLDKGAISSIERHVVYVAVLFLYGLMDVAGSQNEQLNGVSFRMKSATNYFHY